MWKNHTLSGDAAITNSGSLTISNSVIDNANLADGTFSYITGIGAQRQALNMNTQSIQGVTFLQSNTTNPALYGIIRLARAVTNGWRNEADDANLVLAVNVSNNHLFGTDSVVLARATQILTNTTLIIPSIPYFTNATLDHSNYTHGGKPNNTR